jgi:hypothetical protein
MSNKILTIQEAQELKRKPWKPDLDQLKQECMTAINNSVHYTINKMEIDSCLSKADIYIRFGDFDDAFIISNHATKINGIDINTIHMIVEMWAVIKSHLSNNFVDKNPEVCKNAIALLENVRTNKVFDKVMCNKIINRLYEKGKSQEVQDETTGTLDTKETI